MLRCKSCSVGLGLAAAACLAATPAFAIVLPVLGEAQDFAVLAHTTVTNTGSSVIFGSADPLGNVGVFMDGGANATTGFSSTANTFVGPGSNTDGPGIVNAPAAIHLGSAQAGLARNDLINAHSALGSYGTANNLTGEVLGAGVGGTIPTLVAGVYSFDTTAQLNGLLELDAQGTDGGVWIFQIGSSLTTASASAVTLTNPGANMGADIGVFWVMGESATLGTDTDFKGNLLAHTSITLNNGTRLFNGRALAIIGAVTLDTNVIANISPDTSELPANVTGPGSTAPNDGPGFSGGIGFDSETGELALIDASGNGNGNGNGNGGGAIPEPATGMLAGAGLLVLLAGPMHRRQRRGPVMQETND